MHSCLQARHWELYCVHNQITTLSVFISILPFNLQFPAAPSLHSSFASKRSPSSSVPCKKERIAIFSITQCHTSLH